MDKQDIILLSKGSASELIKAINEKIAAGYTVSHEMVNCGQTFSVVMIKEMRPKVEIETDTKLSKDLYESFKTVSKFVSDKILNNMAATIIADFKSFKDDEEKEKFKETLEKELKGFSNALAEKLLFDIFEKGQELPEIDSKDLLEFISKYINPLKLSQKPNNPFAKLTPPFPWNNESEPVPEEVQDEDLTKKGDKKLEEIFKTVEEAKEHKEPPKKEIKFNSQEYQNLVKEHGQLKKKMEEIEEQLKNNLTPSTGINAKSDSFGNSKCHHL